MGSSAIVPVEEREYDGKRRIAGMLVWVWCDALAIAWGVLLIVLAFTDHDRGSTADPNQVFHHYTLVYDQGVGIIGFVGIPALIALLLVPLLYLKTPVAVTGPTTSRPGSWWSAACSAWAR